MKIDKYVRELQNKEMEMLLLIDKICKKHKLDYYLYYGSVLGAVRHNGFIPWDDDVDIALKYNDYLKLLKYLEDELDSSNYYVQTYFKESNYNLLFAKLRNIKTTLIEDANKNLDIVRGAYIDIFPLVGVPDNKIKKELLNINRAFAISSCYEPIINNKLLKKIFLFTKKIFGRKRIINFCYKRCVKYDCDKSNDLCCIFDGDNFEINTISKDILGKPLLYKFENYKLPIPEKYDDYLKNYYNDYMKYPSEEQIKKSMHKPSFIDLNLPYNEYLKRGKNEKN